MADLGFLNFGIGVDGEDLLAKALEKDKKEALEVQKILASIKIEGINFGGAESAVAKSQQAADKAAISSVKLGEARAHAASSSLIGEQKLQTEIEKTAAVQGKSAAEIASIEKAAADKAALAQKKIATEAERTSAVRADASRKELSDNEKLVAMLKEKEAKQTLLDQRVARGLRKQQEDQRRLLTIGPEGQVKFNNAAGLTNKTLFNQKNLLNQISNAAGIYFSIYQVGAFVKNLALVSGEFEMQRISLENILQDVDAANKLFGQIKTLSVVSPFEFKDLVGYAKQLSAFSIPVSELYDTTKRLADVSAGLGVDMGRIILAYGQVRSASVLRGQELRQFTEAGIPLVEELAKKFGELEGRVVSAGEVFDKISNRLVPFAMVKDVFDDLTSEGGKFFEMQEKQSESLKGKIANLKDAYDIMLYSIGTANDGILKGGVEAITELMKNWENLSSVLIGVVGAIGAYRAAMLLRSATDSLASKGIVYNNALTALSAIVQRKANEATLANIALKGKQAVASISLRTCTASEAVSEVVLQMAKKASLSTDSAKMLSEAAMITIRRAGNDQTKIAAAVEAIKTSAMRKGLSATVASSIAEAARTAATTASTVATKGLAASLWALMATNPVGWVIGIIAAIGGAAYAIYHFSSETNRAKDSISELIGTEFTMFENMADDLKSLIGKLKNVTTGSVEYYQILKEINDKYGEYLPNMDKENDKLLALEKSYNAVTEAIKNKQKQEAYTKANEKVEETYAADISEETNDIRKKLKAIGISAKDASILIKKFNDNVKEIGDETSSVGEGSFEARFSRIVMEYFGKDSKMWRDFQNISQAYDPLFTSILGDIDDLGDVLVEQFSMLDFSNNQVDAQFSESFNVKGLTTELEKLENVHKESIEKINIEYEKSGKSRNEIELAIYNSTREYQKKILQTKFEFGEIDSEKLEAGLKRIEKPLSGVKQVVNEAIDSIKGLTDAEKHTIKIKDNDTSSVNEYIKALKGQRDSIQENITMMLKMEAVSGAVKLLKNGESGAPFSVDAIASAKDVISMENKSKAILAVITALGQLDKKTGGTGSNKDLIAEKFKNQIDLIKKAQALYEKYASIMSKEDAVKKVQNDGRFSKTFNPDDYKKSLESIYKLLGNSPEQKKVKEALRDLFGDIDYSEAKKSTDKLLETVNKEIDDYKKKYDFYKTILGITGDESLSQKIAFDVEFIGNPLELMKDKFKDVSGEKFVLGMDTSKMTASAKKMYDDIFSYQEESSQKAYESLLKMQDDLGKQDFSLFGKGWELDLSKIARDVFQKNKEINDREQKAAQELANAKGTLNESVAKAAYDNIIRLGNLERENNRKVAKEKINDLAKSVISDTLSDAGVGEIFSNLSDATFSQISAAKKALSGIDEAALSPDVIEQLNEAGVSAEAFLKILKDIANLKLDNLKDKKLKKIQDIALAATDGIGQLGDSLYSIGEASGDAGLMEIGDMLGTISSLATDIAGALSGNPQDIIKSVFSIATKFLEAEARHKKALKEINDSIIAQQRAYNILLIEQNLEYEKGNSIFGNNTYGKALNGIEEYRKISRKLKRYINAIDQVKIVTGHEKTGLFGWGSGRDTYSSILSVFPKLIKANGEFDAELAKTIIDKGKLDDESKNTLQYMIDLTEKQKEAYAQMNDYLTGLFGDLGNSMSDALVDAFKNGTDASESFYKSVSSMLEKLAKDMVYSMTIGTVIDEYKDKIGDINKNSKLTDEQRFAELAKLVSSFTKDVLAKQGEANELYKKFQEEAKKNNIDIFNPDDDGKKEGLSKGIEGVTEDTSRLIASYLNAMRADLSNQKVYFQKIIDAIIPYQNQFALQVAELKKIEANTYRTANNTEENVRILGRIEGVLNSVTRPSSGKKVNV